MIALYALARPTAGLVRALGAAFLVAQVPHFVNHLEHLNLLPTTSDRLLQKATLLITLLVPLLVLLRSGKGEFRAVPGTAPQVLGASSGAVVRSKPVLAGR